ncbi:Protein of unknown function [Pyronema omphalodes CBS 100304]|uniref:Uncharacterized protein n=1 Tax=Pyronema omphalodes (strain CBS 100304) TaxID=1076935 RepID=U4LSJ9_PYROM|nr:Protein of unknown function [Pyronema omphalodes CBS 100304]
MDSFRWLPLVLSGSWIPHPDLQDLHHEPTESSWVVVSCL